MDQNAFSSIIPNLFQELKNGNLICDDLKPFRLKWTHVTMEKQEPKTALDKYLLKLLCQSVVSRLELQCAREYWSDQEGTVRGTVIHELGPKQRSKLPTNNLCAEQYLSKFGSLASESAHHSKKIFKAKRIRDDLMFNKSEGPTKKFSSKLLKNIFKTLDSMEVEWTLEQRELSKKRIAESMEKSKRANELVDLLPMKCKKHDGPITTLKKFNLFLKSTHKEDKKIFFEARISVSKNHSQERFQRETRIIQVEWFNFTRLFSEHCCYPCPRYYHRQR